ncbi:UV radiation resistance-associated protein [Cricetulus griseus]|uniref:UV radiation resistance-associated protein n=1 Tax=Cricetulus griseus TaxID=10029 RepID=A0A061HY30_CRIGR|nr:UV radiation resistance-associated protein [Cricetulus griseus]
MMATMVLHLNLRVIQTHTTSFRWIKTVCNSYNVFSLLRLHRAQCAIKQTPVIVQRIGKVIEKKLRLTSTSNELKNESECLRLKFLVL